MKLQLKYNKSSGKNKPERKLKKRNKNLKKKNQKYMIDKRRKIKRSVKSS